MKKIVSLLLIAQLANAQKVEWASPIALSSHRIFYNGITQDQKKNIIIAGEANNGENTAFVWKLDSNGTKLWDFQQYDKYKLNGFCSMSVDRSGDVYAGMQRDGEMYKIDKHGNLLWKKPFYAASGRFAVQTDHNNELLVSSDAGQFANFGNGITFTSTSQNGACYMLNYNLDGDCIYGKQNAGAGKRLMQNKQGDIFAFCETSYPYVLENSAQTVTLEPGAHVLKYDTMFNLKSVVKTMAGVSTVDNEGNIFAWGWDVGNEWFSLDKYDSKGKLLWKKHQATITNNIEYGAMQCNSHGDVFFTIGFTNEIKVGEHTFTGSPGWNSLLIKFDSEGELKWSLQNDGGSAIGKNLWVNGSSIYLLGYGSGASFAGKHAGDFFVVKIIDSASSTVSVSEEVLTSQINVYPNPGAVFNIKTHGLSGDIKILDNNGATVHRQQIQNDVSILDLSHLSGGTYFVQVGIQTCKIIIQ